MTKDQIKQSLDYWMGISECECSSTLPSGGCLHCDLKGIKEYMFGEVTLKSPEEMQVMFGHDKT